MKQETNMEEERWYCETCQKQGRVNYEVHADVMTVAHKLEDSHKLESPECPASADNLRIAISPAVVGLEFSINKFPSEAS